MPGLEATDQDLAQQARDIQQNGVLLVASLHSELVGCLAGRLGSSWLTPRSTVAIVLGWWVDPDHRRSPIGGKLLLAFEAWAIGVMAQYVSISLWPGRDRRAPSGYAPADHYYLKAL
jgi:hypothetical protein